MTRKTHYEDCDVLVVGGGMAGTGAAFEARYWGKDMKIIVAEKANIDRSGAVAQGLYAINCYMGIISTLNLLNNQERENRNIYTGSFGYLKFNGDMRFNIIIRSILNYQNQSEISVASGVVIDSNASHEFNENYIKAKALIDLYK